MPNTKIYRCGSLCVEMTSEQAAKWNAGALPPEADASILIHLPTTSRGLPTTETITLEEAAKRLDAGDLNMAGIEEQAEEQ